MHWNGWVETCVRAIVLAFVTATAALPTKVSAQVKAHSQKEPSSWVVPMPIGIQDSPELVINNSGRKWYSGSSGAAQELQPFAQGKAGSPSLKRHVTNGALIGLAAGIVTGAVLATVEANHCGDCLSFLAVPFFGVIGGVGGALTGALVYGLRSK